jgi:hypothetical protein
MRRKLLALVIALSSLAAMPMGALAEDKVSYDGRLDDYNRNVTLDGGSAALTYFIWVGLGALAVIVMFRDSKRSHLD